ncbi:nucleoside hydrolase [Rhodopila sp.]|uniref:nucleoside hydrolase n=1 Tax=Rhodopila sp. TaxID=2480087 RepID=UPI002BB90E69|nr:nucleoside hydrolase [Rhodopila sp.]HVZ06483.1 nucleoside hydrolase [Rhodopila sp.]
MPIPIILDCDPGTDDALAILLALASPELNVLAITVAGGNVGLEITLPNALALVALAGARVPVHGGADNPLLGEFLPAHHIHADNGLGGVILPPGPPPAPGIAADAIRDILRGAPEPVTLVGIGPATNLALALATEPSLAVHVRDIVLMSGGWVRGNITPAAEFNAYSDPEALAILLGTGHRVVFAALDLTDQALATPARLAVWRSLGPGRCLRAACDIQVAVPPSARLGGQGAPLHDPCVIAWLVRPDLFTAFPAHVSVDLAAGPDRGRTRLDRSGRTADNALVLDTLDADRFFALLGDRFASLP